MLLGGQKDEEENAFHPHCWTDLADNPVVWRSGCIKDLQMRSSDLDTFGTP